MAEQETPEQETPERETPKFTGITTHRDPMGRFSVRYPSNWRTFDIREEAGAAAGAFGLREGIGAAPVAGDPHTVLTAWIAPLDEAVVAEDADELKAGVDAGLAQLEECEVQAAAGATLGNLIKFERIYTFREREASDTTAEAPLRKRKQWLLYVDKWLICLTWQGSSPAEYQYWLAMANQSFLTFELPQALWFATDRDLAGLYTNGSAEAASGPAR